MLDEKNAYDNFVNFNGYVPPQNGITAESLIDRASSPTRSTRAVIRPEQFPVNHELLALTVEGERLWEQAWSEFKAG